MTEFCINDSIWYPRSVTGRICSWPAWVWFYLSTSRISVSDSKMIPSQSTDKISHSFEAAAAPHNTTIDVTSTTTTTTNSTNQRRTLTYTKRAHNRLGLTEIFRRQYLIKTFTVLWSIDRKLASLCTKSGLISIVSVLQLILWNIYSALPLPLLDKKVWREGWWWWLVFVSSVFWSIIHINVMIGYYILPNSLISLH